MILYIGKYIMYFNANKIKGEIAMLEYILKILRDAPHTFLHNMLYDRLNSGNFRQNITYNRNSDKFEVPYSEVDLQMKWLLKQNGFGTTEKALEGTNIYIEIWPDSISFWLK